MKTCFRCKIDKQLEDFVKNKHSKDGRFYVCRKCSSKDRGTPEKIIPPIGQKFCKKCSNFRDFKDFSISKTSKDKLSSTCNICRKNYYKKNKERIVSRNLQYRVKNKNKYKLTAKKRYNKKKKELLEQSKQYRLNNKEKFLEYEREYHHRKKNDPLYKTKRLARTMVKRCLLNCKSKRTEDIIGCSFEEFRIYIESKFEPWMNWSNHGLWNGELNYGWDIDHIIPLSSVKTEEEIYKLNHYTNLQPLCSQINRYIKRDKYE